MEKGLVSREDLQNIANAIRNKNGETVTYKSSEMAQAVNELPDVKGLIERNLTSMKIPNNVTIIGKYAFTDCTSLESLTIHNRVTSISDYAFSNCRNLKDITLESGFNANGLNLAASIQYSIKTIVNCLESLADRTGQDTYKIAFGISNLTKLTNEQKAIAINKNWTLA